MHAQTAQYDGSQTEATIRDTAGVRAGSYGGVSRASSAGAVSAAGRLMALARVVELVRHDRLKNDCPKWREGSSPSPGIAVDHRLPAVGHGSPSFTRTRERACS